MLNFQLRKFSSFFYVLTSIFCIISSCSIQKKISKSAQGVLKDSSLATAHVGISIYEPLTNKYWFNYQADHYFTPASNTKIPTCYAAMKYLGDSLEGLLKMENDTAILILPTADPTLLHPDFKNQPVITFLQNATKKIYTTDLFWKDEPLGAGWSWDDYNDSYMAERSPMPVYGNLIKWTQENNGFDPSVVYSAPEVNWKVDFDTAQSNNFFVRRSIAENNFKITEGKERLKEQDVPFVTNGISAALELLPDTIHKTISLVTPETYQRQFLGKSAQIIAIHSQPTDSVLKPMMHVSDNFFAEQLLLMVARKFNLPMNDERVTDTLLKTDFEKLPQKPHWADGSGLSRFNLFSPEDFIFILNKMKNDFGMDRLRNIFPTADEGTLTNYYLAEHGYIFAKTGSLSGVIALSGFLYTKKNKLLIFSVLVNNHTSSGTKVRRAVEQFIKTVRNNY
ncbi:MAG TPA: D-alanyl-D-alanine carboxypeptidase/D-alanyl-D-alanine-endopeptidase [Chitinophagaceae bacterium]|jgi:D-alanyl-D-alanine carboxypeptidase/D-alanyl-D-alanine-endopeptidase (penicillin-binding protein 4)|nr:D-alanyl-D-alanine carboxypeptidase/D-alanyl-D-alanine-endopeptidase [Chitinophagaceae bacterium]